MWVACSPPIARVQQRLVVNLVDVVLINQIVEHPKVLPSGVIFHQHYLFSGDVDWVLSYLIIRKNWYILINLKNGLTPLHYAHRFLGSKLKACTRRRDHTSSSSMHHASPAISWSFYGHSSGFFAGSYHLLVVCIFGFFF